MVRRVRLGGEVRELHELALPELPAEEAVSAASLGVDGAAVEVAFELAGAAREAVLAVLLRPEEKTAGENDPTVRVRLDGGKVEPEIEAQKGSWAWYKIAVGPGRHRARLVLEMPEGQAPWRGRAAAWMVYTVAPEGVEVVFELARPLGERRPMPPLPRPAGQLQKSSYS